MRAAAIGGRPEEGGGEAAFANIYSASRVEDLFVEIYEYRRSIASRL